MKKSSRLRRKIHYYYLKMVKERGTPEYIARGWAIGMCIGWIMPIGTQLLFSIPLSFALRGSKIGATIGTFATNPVTVFFIYPVQCWIGNLITGGSLSYAFIKDALKELLEEQTREALFRLSRELLTDFFVGGVVFALISTPITYFLVRSMVIGFRARMAVRRQRRREIKKL